MRHNSFSTPTVMFNRVPSFYQAHLALRAQRLEWAFRFVVHRSKTTFRVLVALRHRSFCDSSFLSKSPLGKAPSLSDRFMTPELGG